MDTEKQKDMDLKKQLADLKEKNPWLNVRGPQNCYMPRKCEQGDSQKWYYAECDNIKEGNTTIDGNGVFFNLDPAPWIGRWNVENEEDLPKLVVLSLNPGIGDDNFIKNDDDNSDDLTKRGERYYKLMQKWFRGEAKSSEILFDKDWQYYNGDYWIKRMWKLACKVCNISNLTYKDFKKLNNFEKEQIKKLFDKILFIDLFPYHSKSSVALEIEKENNDFKPKFESMDFTRELVEWLIKNDVTFVYARSQWLWEMHVKELATYDKCFSLLNPQSTYFTENNCCTARRKYIDNNPKTTVFESIATTLKEK